MGPLGPRILELHHEGLTPLQISQRVPRSRTFVYKVLKAAGEIPHRTLAPGLTLAEAKRIRQLHELGVPKARIARRMGKSIAQVRYLLDN